MSNPLINNSRTPDIRKMFAEFKSNPMQALTKAHFNLPQNVGNNPQDIIQHLMNTGQLTQDQLNEARGRMSWLKQFF